jgi:protein SCO1/2
MKRAVVRWAVFAQAIWSAVGPGPVTSGVIAAAVLALPAQAEDRAEPLPKELNGVGITEHLGDTLPLDLEFQDEEGKTVRLGEFFDGRRPVILNLVYFSCPMLCTLVLNGVVNGMKGIPWTLGREYVNVTVSIDPAESPTLAARKKASYLESYGRPGVASEWHFLTGQQASITKLADVVGFRYRFNPETREFIHTAGTFICTPEGRLSRYLYGIEYDSQTMKLALTEASSNKIGTTVDKLVLYCFHYDAATGRYAPSAVKLMRLAGGLITVVLAFFLLGLWRREGRRRKSSTQAAGP